MLSCGRHTLHSISDNFRDDPICGGLLSLGSGMGSWNWTISGQYRGEEDVGRSQASQLTE